MADAPKLRSDVEKELVLKAWEDDEFKQRLISDPKGVLAEAYGADLPDLIDVKVLEEDMQTLYIVLPMKPVSEDELTDDQLEAVAGGACIPAAGAVAVVSAAAIGGTATVASAGVRRGW